MDEDLKKGLLSVAKGCGKWGVVGGGVGFVVTGLNPVGGYAGVGIGCALGGVGEADTDALIRGQMNSSLKTRAHEPTEHVPGDLPSPKTPDGRLTPDPRTKPAEISSR